MIMNIKTLVCAPYTRNGSAPKGHQAKFNLKKKRKLEKVGYTFQFTYIYI